MTIQRREIEKLQLSCHKIMTRAVIVKIAMLVKYKPLHEKNNTLGFRPTLTQIGLFTHRRAREARNFGFKKKSNCTICVEALISCAVRSASLFLHLQIVL